VFGAAAMVRWLTVAFTNDHFVHLSRGRQILYGDLPVRDFFDPGLFLQYYASAAALLVAGNNLVGEAVLTVALVALGIALTFFLAVRASGSWVLGAVAGLTAFSTFPRLYNYPKVFLYVLALACMWKYIERPTVWRTLVLAAVTAAAFLFRHDHGLYIGVCIAALLVFTHRQEPRSVVRSLAWYSGGLVALVLPFLVFLQLTVGITKYIRDIPEAQSIFVPRVMWLPFTADLSKPILAVDPPSAGRVMVSWKADVDDGRRRELETRHGLSAPQQQEGSWWRYDIAEDASHDLRALVADPAVAETAAIDPSTFRPITHHGRLRRLRNRIPFLRMRVAPGLFTDSNALSWLYYITMLLPFVGAIVVIRGWRRGTMSPAQVATVGVTVLMCAVINQGLIRESPDSRMADVAGPAAVLGAALTGVALAGKRRRWIGVLLVAWALTFWSAAAHGRIWEQLASGRILAGPSGIREQLAHVNNELHLRPIDAYAPPGSTGLRALTRYVFECTAPADRILVAWFAPEVFFYSERLFAGGQVYLDPGGWHSSPTDQQLTVERLRRQRVPVTLVSAEWEAEVRARFPLVDSYVREHFATVARSKFGGTREYAVMAARGIPASRVYEPLGLPCFR
jgi:hypothetical protein